MLVALGVLGGQWKILPLRSLDLVTLTHPELTSPGSTIGNLEQGGGNLFLQKKRHHLLSPLFAVSNSRPLKVGSWCSWPVSLCAQLSLQLCPQLPQLGSRCTESGSSDLRLQVYLAGVRSEDQTVTSGLSALCQKACYQSPPL